MPCAVFLHVLAHPFVEHLPVFGQVHVDKVYDDDATHVAQSQLPCQFVGGPQVHFERVALLSFFRSCAVAAVHVYHVHGFGVLDNEICPMLVVDGLAEARLDLLGDVEIVKDRYLTGVELHDGRLFRGDKCHVVFHFLEHLLVVHIDVLVGRIEEVAQHGNDAASFLVDELWPLCAFLHLGNGVLPTLEEDFQFGVELGHPFSLSHSSYDNSAIAGLDALDELLESGALFAAFDFRRDRNLVPEWNQYQITACKRQFACQSWPFGRNGFFYDLHQHLLVFRQCGGDAAVFWQVGQVCCFLEGIEFFSVAFYLFDVLCVRVELVSQVKIVKKGVAFVSYVHKTGV